MKNFLENIYSFYNDKSFLKTDPIVFPHNLEGNVEFIAFISSVFAYGRVNLIQKFLESFFDVYGVDPEKMIISQKNIYYRFQSKEDIYLFVNFLRNIYLSYGSLFNYFKSKDNVSIENAYIEFRNDFFEYCKKSISHGLKSLLPDISKSAAKRIWMFFRWMVRDDEIDFGLWDEYETSKLKYPLDTHILTFAYNNKIIQRKANSYLDTVRVTNFMKGIDEEDPVKYDFALSRLGMIEGCVYKKSESCNSCRWKKECVFN